MKRTIVSLIFCMFLMNLNVFADEVIHKRLVKSISYSPQNKIQMISVHKYDEKNRLDIIEQSMSESSDIINSIKHKYNDANDLIEVIFKTKMKIGKKFITYNISNFFFYENGRKTKQIVKNNGKLQSEEEVLEWKDEIPVKSVMKMYNSQEKVEQINTNEFTYKEKDICSYKTTSKILMII